MSEATPQTHTGSCHCGAVKFEVTGTIDKLLSCNCSICRKKGSLLWGISRDAMKVQGEENLETYTFNRHVIHHRFCKTCGMHPFGEAADGKMAAVNVRCLDDIEDLSGFEVVHYDGKSR